jgi:hypothetical protein
MPNLNKVLSYRTIDLNTVCFYAADVLDMPYGQLKDQVKKEAAQNLGGGSWHNAIFDAQAGVLTYHSMVALMKDKAGTVLEKATK